MPSCTTLAKANAQVKNSDHSCSAAIDSRNNSSEKPSDDVQMDVQEAVNEKVERRRRKKDEIEENSSDDDDVRDTKKPCHAREQASMVEECSRSDGEGTSTTHTMEADRDTNQQKMRLYFPEGCSMSLQEKLLWAMKLGRTHRTFEVMFKTGKTRAYLTVGSLDAAEYLTTQGYDGVVMEPPPPEEKLTKVIIFGYPVCVDPEFVLDDPCFISAKRHMVRGEQRDQVVAIIKGELEEDKVRINGLGYRRMAKYVEPPNMCLNCSRWGHNSWSCMATSRCRFCGRGHHSSRCSELIKNKVRVVPQCCNCGGEHNARSVLCPKRPRVSVPGRRDKETTPHSLSPQLMYVPAPQVENKWTRGRPVVSEAAASSMVRAASPSQFPQLREPNAGDAASGQDTTQAEAPTHTHGHSQAGDNSQMMQCIRVLMQELENLKQEVRQLRTKSRGEAVAASDSDKTEENAINSGDSDNNDVSVRPKQRKLKIKGVEKTLKVHDFMENGFGKVHGVLSKCGNDDEKKDKLYKGWLELYKHMSKFAKELDCVVPSQVDNDA